MVNLIEPFRVEFGVTPRVIFAVVVVNVGVDAGMPKVDAVMPECLIKLSSATALLFLLVLVHVVLNRLQYPLLKNVML